MVETLRCDLCVIGAGAGGLTLAAGASQMGASVVLVERGCPPKLVPKEVRGHGRTHPVTEGEG